MFRRSNWCATVCWRGSGRVFGHWEELLRQMKAPVFARGLYTAPEALQGGGEMPSSGEALPLFTAAQSTFVSIHWLRI